MDRSAAALKKVLRPKLPSFSIERVCHFAQRCEIEAGDNGDF